MTISHRKGCVWWTVHLRCSYTRTFWRINPPVCVELSSLSSSDSAMEADLYKKNKAKADEQLCGAADLVQRLRFLPWQACEHRPHSDYEQYQSQKVLIKRLSREGALKDRRSSPGLLSPPSWIILCLRWSRTRCFCIIQLIRRSLRLPMLGQGRGRGCTVHHFRHHLTLYPALSLKPKLLAAERPCSSRHSLA